MSVKYVLVALVVTIQLASVLCINWSLLTHPMTVQVFNEGKHHAHMWCESKNDKIGGNDGIWVPPGGKIEWSFRARSNTQFWCNMDWYGQRVGWDVYVGNWADAPNPAKWSIRNDGVYDQWKNRKWRNLNS